MKHPKEAQADHSAPRDRRPVKPEAGEAARYQAAVPPFAGPAKDDPEQAAASGAQQAGRTKPAFQRSPRPRRTGGDAHRPDQLAAGVRRAGDPSEQYVRLRIRVRGDRLSVVDSHLVDGPLGQSTTFHGQNAYDVTYQDRLLHAGMVRDVGMQRSVPSQDGPEEMRGHHLSPREVFEFSARVPASDVTAETIGGIRVRLHRVDAPASADRLGAVPLEAQFEGQVSPVAEVVGLPESALPEAIEARGGRTASGS